MCSVRGWDGRLCYFWSNASVEQHSKLQVVNTLLHEYTESFVFHIEEPPETPNHLRFSGRALMHTVDRADYLQDALNNVLAEKGTTFRCEPYETHVSQCDFYYLQTDSKLVQGPWDNTMSMCNDVFMFPCMYSWQWHLAEYLMQTGGEICVVSDCSYVQLLYYVRYTNTYCPWMESVVLVIENEAVLEAAIETARREGGFRHVYVVFAKSLSVQWILRTAAPRVLHAFDHTVNVVAYIPHVDFLLETVAHFKHISI